jgi:hypothetical protein
MAQARTDDYTGAWFKGQEVGAMTNCSAASINAAVTCGDTFGIRVEGFNVLTLEILYTRSAGTGWEFYLETCYEGHSSTQCTDAGDWITYTIPINYKRIRLGGFVALGTPDANDKITVNARLGSMNAF